MQALQETDCLIANSDGKFSIYVKAIFFKRVSVEIFQSPSIPLPFSRVDKNPRVELAETRVLSLSKHAGFIHFVDPSGILRSVFQVHNAKTPETNRHPAEIT